MKTYQRISNSKRTTGVTTAGTATTRSGDADGGGNDGSSAVGLCADSIGDDLEAHVTQHLVRGNTTTACEKQ